MNTSQATPSIHGKRRKLVILPIGTIEQHGPYLPIDTDLRIAQLLAEKLEHSFADLSSDVDALLLPAIPFSCSWEHQGVGTVALTVSTVAGILHDLAKSLKAWNMPFLLICVNWHGGNDILASLTTEITATEGIPAAVIPSTAQVGKSWDKSGITAVNDVHAGAVETSVVQAYWPDLVAKSLPASAHYVPDIAPAKTQAVLQSLGSYAVAETGIWGAPEQADPEKGKQLVETLAQQMHDQAKALLELVNRHHR